MGDTGFDSPSDSAGNVGVGGEGGAHSGARGDADAILADQDDPRLMALIAAWPTLADDAKAEILRLAGRRSDDVDDFNEQTRLPVGAACPDEVGRR